MVSSDRRNDYGTQNALVRQETLHGLYRVRDINTKRTLWQRLFGVGTITIASSDKSMPMLEIKNVKDPLWVKELIHENVEVSKRKHRVRLSEISGGMDMDDDLDDEF